jgi:hypothetical protein
MGSANHTSTGVATIPVSVAPSEGSFPAKGYSFRSFVFKEKSNQRYLWIALIGSIAQLILFKVCYPYPDFMSDSYNYIESAALHLNANIWPIGYAKFLYLVHQISYIDTLLVTIQYLLVQLSLLYFFYTMKYLYKPSDLTVKILFVIFFFNPASLYLSNYVLSDALFGSITIVWFSILLWQLNSPTRMGLLIQVILMGLAFTIRYTAIFYPLVAAFALLISPVRRWEKIAWMFTPALLFIPFIRFTQLQTKAVTGTAEFSVFGGWQIANNALYMYGHIQVDSTKLPPDTRDLDRMVKQYYKWAPPGYINLEDFDGTFFIKHPEAPLKQYMLRHFAKEHSMNGFLGWGKVSPMYNEYGAWLVRHYPVAFAQFYLWLNTKNYFNPFLAQMGLYNLGEDSVWDYARYWFHYPTPKIQSISKYIQGIIFFIYPPAFMLLNLYITGCLLWLWFTRKFRHLEPILQKSLLLLTGFVAINFGFSVLATPVVLRYEVIPLLFLFTFSMLLLEFTDFKKNKIMSS